MTYGHPEFRGNVWRTRCREGLPPYPSPCPACMIPTTGTKNLGKKGFWVRSKNPLCRFLCVGARPGNQSPSFFSPVPTRKALTVKKGHWQNQPATSGEVVWFLPWQKPRGIWPARKCRQVGKQFPPSSPPPGPNPVHESCMGCCSTRHEPWECWANC